jgi:hypothetical protein
VLCVILMVKVIIINVWAMGSWCCFHGQKKKNGLVGVGRVCGGFRSVGGAPSLNPLPLPRPSGASGGPKGKETEGEGEGDRRLACLLGGGELGEALVSEVGVLYVVDEVVVVGVCGCEGDGERSVAEYWGL